MDLEMEMSTLVITKEKKRRLSGLPKQSKRKSKPLNDIDEDPQTTPENPPGEQDTLRRSTRKRTAPPPQFTLAPMTKEPEPQRQLNIDDDLEEIKQIYLDRSLKRVNPSLETIFEAPVDKKLMSGRKFRRSLTFDQNSIHNRLKAKKRLMKAQKITGSTKKKKITMGLLMKRLAKIESDTE